MLFTEYCNRIGREKPIIIESKTLPGLHTTLGLYLAATACIRAGK